MSSFSRILCLVAIVALAATGEARADLVFWDDDSGDHDLTNAVNWLGDAYPTSSDYAVLQNNGQVNVTSTAGGISRMYVGADQGGALDPALPMGSATLNVQSGGSLTLGSSMYIAQGTGNTGTVNLTGGSLTSGSFALANGANSTGTFNVSGGAYLGKVYLYSGHAEGSRGAINLSSGSITLDNGTGTDRHIRMGYAANSVGTFIQTGGTVTLEGSGAAYVGMASGAYGYYQLAAGTFTGGGFAPGAGSGAVGVIEQAAGTVINIEGYGIRAGASAGGIGLFNQTGGTVNCDRVLWAGGNSSGAWGQIELGGTTIVTPGEYTSVGRNAGSVGYLNLNAGGVLTTPVIWSLADTAEGGEAYFTFHGGTLKANASTPDAADPGTHFMRMAAAAGGVFIGAEGGTIDTDGNDVVISDPLQALTGHGLAGITVSGGSGYAGPPIVQISGGSGSGATAVATVSGGTVTGITVTNPGTGYASDDVLTVTLVGGGAATAASVDTVSLAPNAADGGLVKAGLGTLTLAGANTYVGLTSVQAGALSVTGSLAGSVAVDADAVLAGTGTIGGDVAAAADSIVGPGMSIGTLSITGNAALAGVLDIEFDSSTDEIDLLAVSGELDLSGGAIQFTDLASESVPLDQPAYVFATYGTLVGELPTVGDVPTGYRVEFAYGGNSIALVVPEPATLVLLASLLVGGLLWRRR